jgi:hypothetical protein
MLHCNMNFTWQTSYALQFLQFGRVVELQGRGSRRQRPQGAHEFAGRRHCEMGQQRRPIGPLLDKHQPQRVLAIDVHRVRDASGLLA